MNEILGPPLGRGAAFPSYGQRPPEGLSLAKLGPEKQALLARAREQFGEAIEPCANKSWEECFRVWRGELMLYFNTPDGNTHLVRSNPES